MALGQGGNRTKRVEISDYGSDLVWLEYELRHVGMAGYDPFGQRLGDVVRGVARKHDAKWWSLRMMAHIILADRVAPGAVGLDEGPALSDRSSVILGVHRQGDRHDEHRCRDYS